MSGPRGILSRQRKWDLAFWCGAAILVLVKLLLTSDLSLQIKFAPHDDSLYVERAWRLLSGDAFGPYDSRILGKYPGISLWLAAARYLGVPFLFSINALYIAAGIYFAMALLRAGCSRSMTLLAFALYLLNPVTLGSEWLRVIREPLDTALLVLLIAAMAHMFLDLKEDRAPWRHLCFLHRFSRLPCFFERRTDCYGDCSLFSWSLFYGKRGNVWFLPGLW